MVFEFVRTTSRHGEDNYYWRRGGEFDSRGGCVLMTWRTHKAAVVPAFASVLRYIGLRIISAGEHISRAPYDVKTWGYFD
jgi:hypothetical protein